MQLRKERTEKDIGLYGIQTLDLSNQLSKQANWELVFIKIGHSLGLNLSQKKFISELSLSK